MDSGLGAPDARRLSGGLRGCFWATQVRSSLPEKAITWILDGPCKPSKNNTPQVK